MDTAPEKIIVHNLKAKELVIGDLIVAVRLVENPYRRDNDAYRVPVFTVSRNLDAEVRELLKDSAV